jgi:hypothetical protein
VTVKQNGLVHRYDRLEAEERFRAALEAAARDDEEEYDRLWDTCPMRRYSMTDAAFTDPWRVSSSLAVAVAVDNASRAPPQRGHVSLDRPPIAPRRVTS